MQTVILAIGLVIFFSYAAAGLFARTRIPDVLLLTLLGIAIGPVLVLAIYLSRALATRFTVARSLDLREAAITAVMAPKGLAAAVLASVPLQFGVPGGEIIRDRTYLVVLISIILTATMVPLIDRGMLRGFFRVVMGPTQDSPGRRKL